MEEWEQTTDTSVERFYEFVKFVVEEGLADEAVSRLKSKGLGKIRVSVSHILETQKMMKEHYANKGKLTKKGKVITESAHQNSICIEP